MLSVKNAKITDLDTIVAIYKSAQDFMIKSGNPYQWGRTYPSLELIESDIREKKCMLVCDENDVHGVFALITEDEPTYHIIDNGNWINTEPYITIHRVASDGKVHGVFNCISNYCKSISSNVRIDTHTNNIVMQHHIEKNGFKKCGIIYVADGSPRIAYQWTDSYNDN